MNHSDSTSSHPSPASEPAAGLAAPRGRFRPGWAVWTTLVILELLAVAAFFAGQVLDRAIGHVGLFLFNFLGLLVLLGWYVFRSSYPGLLRLVVPLSLLGVAVGFFYCFPVQSMSGTLIPTVRWRWATPPDVQLAAKGLDAPETVTIDLVTTTPEDFPQFLGPNRDATLSDLDLARDWSDSPPKLRWKQPIGAGWSAFAAVNGYAVTLEQRGENELVTCYEIETGKLVWSHSEPTRHETFLGGLGPRSTPTIHEGKVYTLGATGRLLCLEGASGTVVWRKDLFDEFGTDQQRDEVVVAWGRANSPLVVDDLVIIPAGGPKEGPIVSLVAFDRLTGERRWTSGSTQIAYASPIVTRLQGTPMIISVNESSVTGHSIGTGEILWTYDWPGTSSADANNSQPHVLEGNRIFISKGYGVGSALFEVSRAESGEWQTKELWKNSRALKTKYTNVAIVDDCAYGLSDGILECVDLESGKSLWKRGRYEHGQLLAVDDLLLVLAEDGTLYLVEATPRAHKELGKIQALEGRTWNNLCLYGKLLLVRNGEEAACYELR